MADDFARQLLDALYNPETQPPQQPSRPLREKLAGAAETVGTLGSGLLASVPAGLAGLTQLIPTRGRAPSVNRAAQKVEDVQSALTYLPRTEAGQEYLEKTAGALGVLGIPAEFLGEQTLKLTGSPFLATTANVGLDPVNYIGIPGTGKATVAATKAAGRTIVAAPRVAGEMISDLVMPAPRAQAQRGAIDLGPQIPEFQPQTALGLVSRADEALAALPRNKGTGAEFLRELEKTPGVRMAELEDRGLVEALSNMGKVTKADVIKALQDNPPVQLKEVMLGSESLTPRQKLTIEYDRAREESGRVGGSTNPSYIERIPESNRTPEEQRLLEAWNRVDQSLEESWLSENPPTKYGQYALPGGENYREILLTLPVKKPSEKDVRLEPRTANFGGSGEGFNAYIGDAFIGSGRTQDEALANALRNAPDDILQNYRSGHWNEPNVLAHARISDRTGPNGEKILHVEEVQSDWHQTGRKSGYKTGKEQQQLDEAKWQYSFNKGMQQDFYRFAEGLPEGDPQRVKYLQQANDLTPKLMKLDSEISRIRQAMEEGVPDAPFKKNWHELMMRRLVDYAAKNGYDRIAITPGAEQASRYDLSKRVDEINVVGRVNALTGEKTKSVALDMKSGESFRLGVSADGTVDNVNNDSIKNFVGKKLSDVIGKDLSSKILSEDVKTLSGVDLQVGGEGMKGFYDKILPTYLNELGKPYGVKVGQTDVITKKESRGVNIMTPDEPEIYPAQTMKVHSFDITPQMREAIKSKGLPLYAKGGSVHISDNPDTMALELQVGGAVRAVKAAAKAAKAAEKEGLSVPYDIPRAPPKTKEEIRAVAERMAKQMTDEFVRPDPQKSVNVAGKTFEQFKREKGFEKDYVTRPTKDVTPPEVADIEKQKGVVKFGIPGDTTIANRELLQAGPYRLEDPSPQHGGPMFPLGGEGAWASNNPIAKNVQTRIGEMSEFFDAPVLGQYMSMGPAGSMFAQHLADANLQAIDLKSMGDRKIEQFNKLLRRGNEKTGPRESFPGIQDKAEAYLYFAFDPKLRIYFNELMQMPSVTQALKLPDGRVILDAITEPELRNKEIMTSGLSQFQFDPNIKPEDIPLSMHPTYTHLIPMKEGAPVTRTRYPTPAELEFSDVANFIRQNYPAKEFTRVMQTGSPRQKIDQQAIDEIKMYEEMMKSLTGKKEGGAVEMASGGGVGEKRDLASKIAGGGIRGVITRGLLGMDPPEDMTPREREVYENAVRASAPALGLAAAPAAIIKGAKGAKAAKPVYPQAEALERARQNAVKMLNLPENNTPEMRAQAMGYIDYLHGTQRLDRLLEGKTLDPRRATSGPMPYGTTTPELASSYATSKADTSRRAADEGDVRRYFEVAPKDIGLKGMRSPLPVETAWHFMTPEQQAKIRELAPRVGYENLDEFTGNLIVHPEGVNGNLSADHWNWLMKNEAKGNPLTALRHMWYESGQLVDEPETLGQIYRLAGVNAPISQTKAPWTESQGVLLGKARITNPIDTSNTEQVSALIEPLKQAFARDRSRTKAVGPDQWAKDVRYTPRSWVSELEKDLAEGKESYVWTSIPDKVTAELRRLGFNGIIDRSGKGGGAKEPVVIPFDPAQVRSRFAAFDPAEMDVPDLLKATGGIIKAATKAVKPTAEQAATMAAQRAELMLRSRAMQELKDQFENLPQPPKGFLSPENILQRMDEIRRREATPSGEQIPLLKKGGAIEMQAGGALKAAAKAAERAAKTAKPEVLTAAERDANLAKMLQESKAKTRLYHGTKAQDEYADEPGQAFKQFASSPTWLAQEPYTAQGYAGGVPGSSIYQVYAQVKNPLNLRFDANEEASKAFPMARRLGVDVNHIKGMSNPQWAWEVVNHPSFIDAVEKAGYDAIMMNEGGYKTFGVLDPRRIKSATGNRGTFDVTNPDITKKRGGKVSITDNLDTMRLAVQKRK